MTLFYLDTAVDGASMPDRSGFEAADERSAVRTAFAALLDIVHDQVCGEADLPVEVSVRDRQGVVMFQATLSTLEAALDVSGRFDARHLTP